jgi:signal transduction histidine kinase
VRKGAAASIEGDFPREVAPLVAELNALLREREQAVHRARSTAGDLAHGLKTPLALLAQEAEQASQCGAPELGRSLSRQVERMTRLVEHHLARSSAAASSTRAIPPCALAESAAALLRTLDKLHAARALHFECGVDDSLLVPVRREDLDEMLGNLLDNACKWTRTKVVVRAERTANTVMVLVEDDGPCLPAEARVRVLERGVRADEQAPGTGLGLGIVRELAEIYGGAIQLEVSPLGGLLARLSLPLYSGSLTSSPGFNPSAI